MAGINAASADLYSLAQDLTTASGGNIEQTASELISQTAQKIALVAQAKAPVKTGELRSSIKVHYISPLKASVGPDVSYGAYQEFGTGSRGEFGGAIYEIKPKKPGGVLVFKVNGKTVFARSVKHPGIKAHPYMRPAFEEVMGETAKLLADKGQAQITRGPNAI